MTRQLFLRHKQEYRHSFVTTGVTTFSEWRIVDVFTSISNRQRFVDSVLIQLLA